MIFSKRDDFFYKLLGDNFSGRSNYLKSICQLDNNSIIKKNIYLGNLPNNYLTGLFPLVANEIDFHLNNNDLNDKEYFRKIIDLFNFKEFYNRNPFTLSGGEQTILVLLTSLFLKPNILALDNLTEQLDEEWRNILLTEVFKKKVSNTIIYLSDNRVSEYDIPETDFTHIRKTKQEYKTVFIAHKKDLILPTNISPINIKLEGLTFYYEKKKKILDNLNISLNHSNIYLLKGKNGSGKSTLAKILTGIIRCKHGSIASETTTYNTYKYPGKIFGYSHQSPDEQLFSSSVDSEIINITPKTTTDNINRKKIILEAFGFDNIKFMHPAELPFVIRKRISLASTLAYDRAWYIFDEPSLGQDTRFVEFICNIFKNLANAGKGIIIITHSNIFEKYLKHNILFLNNGKIYL